MLHQRPGDAIGRLASRQEVGIGEQVALEILGFGIDLSDAVRVSKRRDQLRRIAEACRREARRGFLEPEPLGKGHRVEQHLAPRELVDHLERR